MTKRFCDLCQKELKPEDDIPFIRHINTVVVSLIVTNEFLHAINDVCNSCKVSVVTEGSMGIPKKDNRPVATLQQPEESKPFAVFKADEPPIFESSVPATQTEAPSSGGKRTKRGTAK